MDFTLLERIDGYIGRRLHERRSLCESMGIEQVPVRTEDRGDYVLHYEKWRCGPTEKWVDMCSAKTQAGDYIGEQRMADFLVKKGIAPEKAKAEHSVCSIGKSSKDGKWYGWSHRAMKGFGIGDVPEEWSPGETKRGSRITTDAEARAAAVAFADSVS